MLRNKKYKIKSKRKQKKKGKNKSTETLTLPNIRLKRFIAEPDSFYILNKNKKSLKKIKKIKKKRMRTRKNCKVSKKRKMKGGQSLLGPTRAILALGAANALAEPEAVAAAVAVVGAGYAGKFLSKFRCKTCLRIWTGHGNWIWKTDKSYTTAFADIDFRDFRYFNNQLAEGVCGICNGNHMYDELISSGVNQLTSKIKVIKKLISDGNLSPFVDVPAAAELGDDDYSRGMRMVEPIERKLAKLEDISRKFFLAMICVKYEIPIEVCDKIGTSLLLRVPSFAELMVGPPY